MDQLRVLLSMVRLGLADSYGLFCVAELVDLMAKQERSAKGCSHCRYQKDIPQMF